MDTPRPATARGLLRPIRRQLAHAFIREHHRHLPPPVGQCFALGLYGGTSLLGVIIAGRPVARLLDDGLTLEITRCATTGTPNAPSQLYAAVVRVAQAMGYLRVITYTRADETGASVKAAGFHHDHDVRAETWDRPARPRQEELAVIGRRRWVRYL